MAVPIVTPVITPFIEPAVATDGLLLLHMPVPLVTIVIVEPRHSVSGPQMQDGTGFTNTVLVTKHPPQPVKVITALPSDTPQTIGDPDPTEATAGLLLLHVPQADVSLKPSHEPTHILSGPAIGSGNGNTVSTFVT